MRKRKLLLASVLTVLVLASFMCQSAFADASVTYSSDSHEFIISADGKEGTADLFGEMFKGMMPGDSATETVTVSNTSSKTAIRLYMRLDYLRDSERAMLKAVEINVSNENGTLFNKAAGAEFPASSVWTYLCTLNAGASSILNVRISAPIQMGNPYQYADADVVWRFKVEEGSVSSDVTTGSTTRTTTSTTETGKSGVKTGDDCKLQVYIILAMVSSSALAAAIGLRKRERYAKHP